MLRPSHTITTLSSTHVTQRRLAVSGFALAIHAAIVWALMSGLAVKIADTFHPFTVGPLETIRPTQAPPPIPRTQTPVPATTEAPIVTMEPAENGNPITAALPQTPAVIATPPVPVRTEPDRAPAIIAATRTLPPYPALARRLGAEGKVVLRLNVLADGHVAQAQVVTSSGHAELDEAAREWITAHWTYKPAIHDGVPAPAQTLASVAFSLNGP